MIVDIPLLLTKNNATPMYVACQSGHHDIVLTLLGAGADVNTARSDVSDVIHIFAFG